MNKKGISAVVGTVFLVFLTIVGVSIVWVVISNLVQDSSDEVEGDCLSVRAKPVSCKIYPDIVTSAGGPGLPGYPQGDTPMEVVVRRESGSGNLGGLRFLFNGEIRASDGTIVTSDVEFSYDNSTVNITQLGTEKYQFDLLWDDGCSSPPCTPSDNFIFDNILSEGQTYAIKTINVASLLEDGKICNVVSNPISCECVTTISGSTNCQTLGY